MHHNRAAFLCTDEPALQEYIRDDSRALKEHQLDVTRVYVLINATSPTDIIGYVTLSNATVIAAELPNKPKRGLPLYKSMPAMLLGRMAVDDGHRGRGYGRLLVLKAFDTCIKVSTFTGCVSLLLDPKNDKLADYYRALGFAKLRDSSRMFIMMPAMREIIADSSVTFL